MTLRRLFHSIGYAAVATSLTGAIAVTIITIVQRVAG